MKIVILCGNYYPNSSAVGICAERIAESFSNEHEVMVLSVSDSVEGRTEFTHNNVKVYKDTPVKEKSKYNLLRKCQSDNLQKGIRYYYKIKRMASIVGAKYSLRTDFIYSFKKLLAKISTIDVIIACCMPFESLIAAYDYKVQYPHTKICFMMYDGFADARTTHYFDWNKKIKFKRHIALEDKLMRECHRIFYVHQNQEHLLKYHSELRGKFVEIEHPSIIPISSEKVSESIFQPGSFSFVYGGGLKKGYIDPTYFVKLIAGNTKFNLYIYTSSNALDQFKELNKIKEVHLSNWLTQEELINVQSDCDFLVNFATYDGHQLSSKIFSYFSLGKPFIHVYYDKQDSNLKYISKYPLALCIDANRSISQNRDILTKWCEDFVNHRIDYSDVLNLFKECTPEYICKTIYEEICDA